jgi:subtilisin family serine protease
MLAMVAAFGLPSPAVVRTDGTGTRFTGRALVRLVGDPLSVSAKTKPAPGRKINFNSTSVKNYRAVLSARRNEYKKWLQANAPKARVTSEFDVALNAVGVELNGTPLSKLQGSTLVAQVQMQRTYRMAAHDDPDLELVNGLEGWQAAESFSGNQGEGIKIGIVDAGIVEQHPCFDGTDYGDAGIAHPGWTQYTNDKVVVAKVFHNNQRKLGLTPEPTIQGHGTHVSGTAACEEHTAPAIAAGVTIPYAPSGVAPRAFLGNYNVFPGDVASSRSEDILDALDEAAEDGMDVINMSLGDVLPAGRQDLDSMAVDNLDRSGIVVAVSAGNEGPGHDTIGTPGSAARALTAGASQVGHQVVQHVGVGSADYDAVRGDFGQPDHDVTAPMQVVPGTDPAFNNLSLACDPLTENLTGKIALISRGVCDFTIKVRNVKNAGGVGVIIGNRIPGEPPFVAGHNDLEPKPDIPAFMISFEDAADAKTHDGESATLYYLGQYKLFPDQDNRMAEFSSQGPTNVSYLVKPDLVAPGQNILSSWVGDCGDEGCWDFLQGTSMASPHLAGAAAVVRDAHPSWTPPQVRSAITNTADRNVLTTVQGDDLTDVLIEGAGLLQLDDAVNAVVALDPVSVSFGRVPSGSGQTRSATLKLTNISSAARTYSVAADAPFSVSASTATLSPGQSATVTVTYAAPRGTVGDVSGYLVIGSGTGEVAHAVLYALQG